MPSALLLRDHAPRNFSVKHYEAGNLEPSHFMGIRPALGSRRRRAAHGQRAFVEKSCRTARLFQPDVQPLQVGG